MQDRSNKRTRQIYLLLSGFLSFILIGVIQAMYGPAFFSFQDVFGVSEDQVAFIVSMHFIGSFTAILSSYKVFEYFGYKKPVIAGGLLFILGVFGIAFSSSWVLTLASGLLIGFGSGLIDVSMNIIFLRSFASRSAPALNMLHAMFGVGSVLGPLLIGLFLANISTGFVIVALMGVLFVLMAIGLEPIQFKKHAAKGKFAIMPMIGFILLYFTFATVEVSLPSWEPTYLAPYFSKAKAVYFTSLFWLGMTVGRFVAVPLSMHFKANKILLISTTISFLAAVTAYKVALAPYAYVVVGFAIAPVFATALAWLNEVYPEYVERLSPILFASANVGAILGPPLVGFAVAGSGGQIIATMVSVFAFSLMLVTVLVYWQTRKL